MASFEYLADGHDVDDAGNLIVCTCVDSGSPAERFPITVPRKASSKRHAIPGCETIRISKPSCFLKQGEGLAAGGEYHYGTQAGSTARPSSRLLPRSGPRGTRRWQAAADAVSPIRRVRAFARALGAIVAEQAGPRGCMTKPALEGDLRTAVVGSNYCEGFARLEHSRWELPN